MSPGKLALWTDAQGQDRLLVIETAGPNRMSEWTTDGKLLREWFCCNWAPTAATAPTREPRAYLHKRLLTSGEWFATRWTTTRAPGRSTPSGRRSAGGEPGCSRAAASARGLSTSRGGSTWSSPEPSMTLSASWSIANRAMTGCPVAALIPRTKTGRPAPAVVLVARRQRRRQAPAEEYQDNPTTLPGTSATGASNGWTIFRSSTPAGHPDAWRIAPTGFDKFGNPIYDGKGWAQLLTDTVYAAREAGTADALDGANE